MTSHLQTARDWDPRTLLFWLAWSLFGCWLISVKQPGSGPKYPKRQRPPSPFYLAIVPRLSGAMERWLP